MEPPIQFRRGIVAALCVVALAAPAPAFGAPESAQLQTARELFARAEIDEDGGRWQDALEKLRRVGAVKLTAGVRYHIALCEMHTGHLASALAGYALADSQAVAENAKDVAARVGVEMAPLAARVPRLAIRVSPERASASITLDGQVLDPHRLGATLAVDPGAHRVDAAAPGRGATSAVVMAQEGEVTFLQLDLPPETSVATPSAARVAAAPAVAGEPSSAPVKDARVGAIVSTAAAVAFAGAGVGAYVAADGSHKDALRQCATATSVDAAACDSLRGPIRAWDWAAAGAWTASALSAGIAIFLWSRPASERVPSPLSYLMVGPSSLAAAGSF